VYGDPLLFLPGNAGKWNLQPMYMKLANVIRKYDKNHIIFYEPVTWGMLLDGEIIGSGFNGNSIVYCLQSIVCSYYYPVCYF
jgi:endoglycosylceramidase